MWHDLLLYSTDDSVEVSLIFLMRLLGLSFMKPNNMIQLGFQYGEQRLNQYTLPKIPPGSYGKTESYSSHHVLIARLCTEPAAPCTSFASNENCKRNYDKLLLMYIIIVYFW